MNQKEYGDVLSDVHVYSSYHLNPKSSCAVTRVRICIPSNAVNEPWKKRAVEHHYCNSDDTEPLAFKETRVTPRSLQLQNSENLQGNVMNKYVADGERADNGSDTPSLEVNVRGRKRVTVEVSHDEDGDLVLRRKKHQSQEDVLFLTIQHSLATGLDSVGEQIWNGAMLMADFIIHNKTVFKDQSLLELGAGTGVTSIVAAMYAHTVFCTDIGDNVLRIARDNCERNMSTYPGSHQILVREMDWFKDLSEGRAQSEFYLSESEQEVVKNIPILMAADVIYDIDATAAFFKTIKHLMSHPKEKSLYIALEKRLVFTVSDLDIASPGYEHFRECLDILQSHGNFNGPQFHCEQLSTTFPQYLNYNRSKYLELWKVTSRFPKT
ncbi:hypothetical protein CHS0354_039533 [Potamilus streckersoni]|uniref:Methyltransferase-like protein 22 n=1 Tax=Potamilus streckersoni TaxID=2493646 RepID=A0AAE0TL65_9BIVA|nr:hypothetical protein CHS0354_039533 [Potamilus streckersoni]